MYIKRALEPVVRRYAQYFKVVVVTGPRQVGKTTMLKHLMEEDKANGLQRNYITLDNGNALRLAKEDPALFLQRYEPPVLIDEIQKAPELLPAIKMIVDESDAKGAFWLTGSQPFHLMRHVSETLAGRVALIEMLGLSNAEIGGYESVPFVPSPEYYLQRVHEASPFGVNEAFARIVAGSLPAIRTLPSDLREEAYESYLATYVMRDIRDLTQVADEQQFRRFMAACASGTGRPVVYAELARLADISEPTAKKWLSLLTSSYVVKVVQPFTHNRLKRLVKQPVLHFTDLGLASYLAGWSDARALEAGPASGHFFESFAFGELYRSYSNAGKRPPLNFLRSNDRKEIDIILEHQSTLYPVEVKKAATARTGDLKNLSMLDPLTSESAPEDTNEGKQDIGLATVLNLGGDAYPITPHAWAFPVWGV